MATPNTSELGFENELEKRPACCAEIWMPLNTSLYIGDWLR